MSTVGTRIRRSSFASSTTDEAVAADSSHDAMAPIITETGFIIPASARPIIDALARKSGSFKLHQRTVITIDTIAKSDLESSPEDPGSDIETVVNCAPVDLCSSQHLSSSPYDSMPFSSGIKANHCTTHIQDVQLANLSTAPWMVQTAWMAEYEIPESPSRWASASFIGIRHRARLMIANEAPLESIIGPTSLHRLLDDRVRDPDLQWNVSDWAQDFMSNFPHMNIPDKVACWAILWKVLRWQTFQSKATFEQVPGWCRPSPSEMFCPHMPIIICLAWPKLRRFFVEQASNADWVQAVMGSISVSWPYGEETVFKTEANGALAMSDAFEAWINDGSNWSLSVASARAMIGIEGRARVR
ncbi:hypothetical protein D6C84_07636 [Aureobasidium pullulans]|uniref:Uncharacterized protein n=1 Tax=Aureobasidium pullulans TaxID=5580 RepID=A0A4S9XKM9_AURPU|nr:hypothetical protein D6C84_07636 [Aureobasidium pullulans]